jgi:hypothetical protein
MPFKYVETCPYRPPNGTEGEFFEARFCDLCERDADAREGEAGPGPKVCAIHTAAFGLYPDQPGYPAEWVVDKDDDGMCATARCTAFVPDGKAFAEEARRFVARENAAKARAREIQRRLHPPLEGIGPERGDDEEED